jgi:hypothetical protein
VDATLARKSCGILGVNSHQKLRANSLSPTKGNGPFSSTSSPIINARGLYWCEHGRTILPVNNIMTQFHRREMRHSFRQARLAFLRFLDAGSKARPVRKRNEEEPSPFELLPQIFKAPSQHSVPQQSCQTPIVALGSLQFPSQLVIRTTHPAFVRAKSPERHLEDSATTLTLSPSLSPRFKAAEWRIASGSTAQRAPSCAAAAPCWHS